MRVEKRGGTAYISATDLVRNFKVVYEQALQDHGTLVVESNQKPVAVLTTPDNVDTDVEVYEYETD